MRQTRSSRRKVLCSSTLHSNPRAHHYWGGQCSTSSQNSQLPFISPSLIHSPTKCVRVPVPITYCINVIDGHSRNSPACSLPLFIFIFRFPSPKGSRSNLLSGRTSHLQSCEANPNPAPLTRPRPQSHQIKCGRCLPATNTVFNLPSADRLWKGRCCVIG